MTHTYLPRITDHIQILRTRCFLHSCKNLKNFSIVKCKINKNNLEINEKYLIILILLINQNPSETLRMEMDKFRSSQTSFLKMGELNTLYSERSIFFFIWNWIASSILQFFKKGLSAIRKKKTKNPGIFYETKKKYIEIFCTGKIFLILKNSISNRKLKKNVNI